MNKFLPVTISAMLAYPTLSHAGTITESMSIDEQIYDWNTVLSLPKFNTNLGKLESVYITETSNTNLSVLARNYSYNSDGIVSYYYGEKTTIKPLFLNGTLSSLNNFGGNLSILYPQQEELFSSYRSVDRTINYGSDLERFTSPWSLSLSGKGYGFVSLYGEIGDINTFYQDITLSVTYNYSDVPEPSIFWIFVLGLFSLFTYRTIYRKSQ